MKNAIEVHNYTTAIHELFIVKHKPKTTLKLFDRLQDVWNNPENYINNTDSNNLEEIEHETWNEINNNDAIEYIGEVDFRDFTGGGYYKNNRPYSQRVYSHGQDKYNILAYYHFPM